MAEHVYKLVELVGTSGASVSDAIQNAITRASATVRNIGWFEVAQVRGEVKDGEVGCYQVGREKGAAATVRCGLSGQPHYPSLRA